MCRLGVGVVLVLIAAGGAGAQASRSAQIRAEAAHLDAVVGEWKKATAVLAVYDDSVRRSRAALDTIRSGPLQVLVARAFRARVERSVPAAIARTDSRAGSASARLATHWLIVRPRRDSLNDTLILAALGPNGREVTELWGDPNDTTLAQWMSELSVRQISDELRPAVANWLHSEMVPDTVTANNWGQVRLDLVSTHSTVTRQCYAGDLTACKSALRLTMPADPATAWMDARDRRVFVGGSFPFRGRFGGVMTDTERLCVAGSDDACLRATRDVDWTDWRSAHAFPASPLTRLSLARFAVQLGGRDGYERLLRESAPGEALAAAAGIPLDSLLTVWQARVHNTRLPSQDMSAGIAAGSLAWILLCGALSLRSSRWR